MPQFLVTISDLEKVVKLDAYLLFQCRMYDGTFVDPLPGNRQKWSERKWRMKWNGKRDKCRNARCEGEEIERGEGKENEKYGTFEVVSRQSRTDKRAAVTAGSSN